MHEDIELIFQCGDSLQPLPTDEDNNSDITSASFALASDSVSAFGRASYDEQSSAPFLIRDRFDRPALH